MSSPGDSIVWFKSNLYVVVGQDDIGCQALYMGKYDFYLREYERVMPPADEHSSFRFYIVSDSSGA